MTQQRDNGLVFDGEGAYYEGGGVKWYPQPDPRHPAYTWPPPVRDDLAVIEDAER